MSNTTTTTKTLPATLVEVPENFPWELRNYQADPYLGSESVQLTRDGAFVILAKNEGRGAGSQLEIWSRGNDAMFARERRAIQDVLAAFHEAGLKYRMDHTMFGGSLEFVDYDEERLADLLLTEAAQVKNLSRGRNVLLAKNRKNLTEGKFHTLRKSAHLSDDEAVEAVRKVSGAGAFVWSRGKHEWLAV